MKFALFEGNKIEAFKRAKGVCPNCGSELIAKCGEVKVNYWSHKGTRNCDPWWENETEWHRSWKGNFPVDWQEVIHVDKNGEKHIADIKTPNDWVIEFQHSYLNPEERRARNTFYQKIVWVVDGTRRKTDIPNFHHVIDASTKISTKPLILKVHFPDECRLLKEWHDNKALIFFDFQEELESKHSILWFILPKISSGATFLLPFPKAYFIELHNNFKFDEFLNNTILPYCKKFDNNINNKRYNIVYNPPNWLRRSMNRRF
jgi:hypothetical protein